MKRVFHFLRFNTALRAAACLAALAAALTLDILGPSGSDSFGAAITVLPNGNLVICDPGYDTPGAADVGAVYLYNGSSGAMISALTGSAAGDQVGSGGVTVLANGNYVVASPYWDHSSAVDAGAVTWGSAVSGVSGVVSEVNSLVGSASDDLLGSGSNAVVALVNGNYLVFSPNWDNGSAIDAGAVSWGSGVSGLSGVISALNSLVGSSNGDRVGAEGSFLELPNGNYLVLSPEWDNGAQVDAGAAGENTKVLEAIVDAGAAGENTKVLEAIVDAGAAGENTKVLEAIVDAGAATWGSAASGVSGPISALNSLVGVTAYDQVGLLDPLMLPNGAYLVLTPFWDNGAAVDAGAVTWGSGVNGVSGPVGAANSLVGSSTSDRVGDQARVTILFNGNYLVSSPLWDNGSTVDAGAVTWGSAASGVSGAISDANSLVGSTPNDRVGAAFSVTRLVGGNFVVVTPNWDNGAIADVGAATWGNGSLGISGAISAANSLVGSVANDRVGYGGVVALANGNYAVQSPVWDNGAAVDAGAITWADGSSGCTGTLSSANSLVGSSTGEGVGFVGRLRELVNGDLIAITPDWDNGPAVDAGAVTWLDGDTGLTGVVSAANSLVGAKANDRIGSGGASLLNNGNYIVISPEWDNGPVQNAGAYSWVYGGSGVSGAVSSSNSLVGSAAGDLEGAYPAVELANGNFVLGSPSWDNGAILDAGAATWVSGAAGAVGVISGANSLVGLSASDRIGADILALENGNYLVISPEWDNGSQVDAGAVTWGSGTAGVKGLASPANSLVGASAGDRTGSGWITELYNGNYVVRSPDWDNGAASDAGAITWANGATGIAGLVSPANSLVGSHSNDLVGFYPIERLSNGTNGSFIVLSPDWDNGSLPDAGAATWVNGQSGLAGAIGPSNSLVGGAADDAVGQNIVGLAQGNYLVLSPLWDNGLAVDAGAVTWGSGAAGVKGLVSPANSLVGSSSDDGLGSQNSVGGSERGDYVVLSPGWDNGGILDAGAVTWGDGLDGTTTGEVTAQNSLLGTVAGGGPRMTFHYDSLLGQYLIGRPAENRVSLYRLPSLEHKIRLPLVLR